MWDIMMAWLGPATCPWCSHSVDESWYDRTYNKLPDWVVTRLLPYDTWTGKIGRRIHRKHVVHHEVVDLDMFPGPVDISVDGGEWVRVKEVDPHHFDGNEDGRCIHCGMTQDESFHTDPEIAG